MSLLESKNETQRDSWIKDKLSSLKANSSILDCGAGEQKYKKHCDHLIYTSQDFNEYNGTGDETGLQIGNWDVTKTNIVSDICSIPLDDASFDSVICTEVLEHVPDPIKVIAELTRLLRPGGKLILTAPFASMVHLAPYYYYSGFSKYWYEHHLEKDYKIDELVPNGNWYDHIEQELMRIPYASSDNYFGKIFALIPLVSYKIWSFFAFKKNKRLPNEICCFGYHLFATKI
jgi:ubiquinone/menaquinone biosynthesis C-methylase UbiE